MVLVSFYQVRFEAEALNQFQCRGLLRDEGIRAAFEQKAVALPSLNDPAKTRAAFKQGKINLLSRLVVAFDYPVSCCQASDAATNYYDSFHLNICLRLCRRTVR